MQESILSAMDQLAMGALWVVGLGIYLALVLTPIVIIGNDGSDQDLVGFCLFASIAVELLAAGWWFGAVEEGASVRVGGIALGVLIVVVHFVVTLGGGIAIGEFKEYRKRRKAAEQAKATGAKLEEV
jgi:hypothetical protein